MSSDWPGTPRVFQRLEKSFPMVGKLPAGPGTREGNGRETSRGGAERRRRRARSCIEQDENRFADIENETIRTTRTTFARAPSGQLRPVEKDEWACGGGSEGTSLVAGGEKLPRAGIVVGLFACFPLSRHLVGGPSALRQDFKSAVQHSRYACGFPPPVSRPQSCLLCTVCLFRPSRIPFSTFRRVHTAEESGRNAFCPGAQSSSASKWRLDSRAVSSGMPRA